MNTPAIRIERLAVMKVARFHARGVNPELAAWSRLQAWAEPLGLLKDPIAHPVFGFNNPSPSIAHAEYGYEFWIRLELKDPVGAETETLAFPGGWYAVTTHHGFPNPGVWMDFLKSVRTSPYRYRRDHELEHPHNPLAPESEMVFDLYLPIEDPRPGAPKVERCEPG